jgi:hypothetical protein
VTVMRFGGQHTAQSSVYTCRAPPPGSTKVLFSSPQNAQRRSWLSRYRKESPETAGSPSRRGGDRQLVTRTGGIWKGEQAAVANGAPRRETARGVCGEGADPPALHASAAGELKIVGAWAGGRSARRGCRPRPLWARFRCLRSSLAHRRLPWLATRAARSGQPLPILAAKLQGGSFRISAAISWPRVTTARAIAATIGS